MKEKKGVPLSDVWEIPYLNPKAKESSFDSFTQEKQFLIESPCSIITKLFFLVKF